MFGKIPLKAVTGLVVIGLSSCSGTSVNSSSGRSNAVNTSSAVSRSPLVVATTSVLCDLTKQIAAQTIDLKCLVDGGADPHTYQAKPEDRKAIEQANLVLYGGYNFEPNMIKLVEASSNKAVKVAVYEVAVPKPIIQEEQPQEKAPDPHVWHNPQNGVEIVEVIRSNLEKVAPANAQLYAKNAEKVEQEIKQIDSWIKQNVATIPATQRKLVTTHDALSYYTQAYNIGYAGAIEGLSTQAEPTAARIGELSKEIKQENVPTIFAESTHNSQLIQRVAQEANVKVSQQKLYADGLGEQGTDGDTYQKMLVANTKAIVEGLGGKYTALRK